LVIWRKYLGGAPVILDVGANDGTTTNDFLAEFPDGRVYAFEPDPRAIAKFKRNVTSSRAQLFETAIGAIDGTAEFYVSGGIPPWATSNPRIAERHYPDGWDESGSIRKPKSHRKFWPWVTFETKSLVPIARLDTWSREHCPGPIDLIWADVQGAESDLIEGGQETLARSRFFYTEFSDDEWYEGQATLKALQAMIGEFALVGSFGPNVLLARR
jgi:FkbM family methyltransferase